MTRTTMLRKEDVDRKWLLVDASGKTLGRMATRIARILTGKTKPNYTPHVDNGDYVVVINASQVKTTGQKALQKVYRHHTGYIGNLKVKPFKRMMEHEPEEIIRLAVRRMLPKNKLGKKMFKKLRVYKGDKFRETAQKPEPVEI